MYKGRCVTSVFKVPNVFRGIASSEGGQSLALPISVTATQAIIFVIIAFIMIPVQIIIGALTDMGGFVRLVVFNLMIPVAVAYFLGSKEMEKMNFLRYIILWFSTKYEPSQIIAFEEVEATKRIKIKQRIRMKRSVRE